MTDYSVSTTALADSVALLKTTMDDFRGTYKTDVEYLTIGRGDLPLFDGGFGGSYDALQDALASACTSMGDAMESVHNKLRDIVQKYEDLEEEHGLEFDDSLAGS